MSYLETLHEAHKARAARFRAAGQAAARTERYRQELAEKRRQAMARLAEEKEAAEREAAAKRMEAIEEQIRTIMRQTIAPGVPLMQRRPIEIVAKAAAFSFNITVSALRSHRKTADISHPRQIAMYLASVDWNYSLPQIGRYFGGRDHTTALHGIRKIAGLVAAQDAAILANVAAVRDLVKAGVER